MPRPHPPGEATCSVTAAQLRLRLAALPRSDDQARNTGPRLAGRPERRPAPRGQ
eukprot:ctg_3854.g438